MVVMWHVIGLAFIFNLPVGYFAVQKNALSIPDGVITAGILGVTLFISHPLFWTLLIVFFTSSTLLTKYKGTTETKKNAIQLAEKGGQRDAYQVIANGGIPFVVAVILLLDKGWWTSDLTHPLVLYLVTSLAVVTSDTWATELGVTSSGEPRSILNPLITVPRGTSGGISLYGLFASLLGATMISLIYVVSTSLLSGFSINSILLFLLISLGGLLGSILDSFLGATIQSQYRCDSCEKLTEKKFHKKCNTPTEFVRGLNWFGNDLVNSTSSLIASFICVLFYLLI